MAYCLYNAIKTPDGTILWCENSNDYKSYKDTVSGETYMNDGMGKSIRRSVNIVPYEDLSIDIADDFEKVRTVKFWGSYGKDGKSPKKMMSLEEMEESHIEAILATQKQVYGTELEKIFLAEIKYRIEKYKEQLEEKIPVKNNKKKKIKI